MDGDVNINFSDRDGDILDFQASHQFEEWHGIKRIAQNIFVKARDIRQEFEIDKLTRGSGDCFPISILQQLNRRKIWEHLDLSMKRTATSLNHSRFRNEVCKFMLKSRHKLVVEYKKQLEEVVFPMNRTTWTSY